MLARVLMRALVLLLLTSLSLPLAELSTQPALARSKTRTVTKFFSNVAPIAIPGTGSEGAANPYPSQITVSGLRKGKIKDINVHLNNLSHTFPDDIDMLLAAAQLPGVNAIIMSDIGGNIPAVDVNLVLDNSATSPLPVSGPLVSGTFQPTNGDGTDDLLDSPAPSPSGVSSLAFFNGKNPNGTWQLYVDDDSSADTGSFAGGWALEITANVKVKEKKHHQQH